MARAEIVETAKFRPGKCLITRHNEGPFIDTGVDIPRYGRVYLSIPKNAWLFREAGFLSQEKSKELNKYIEKLEEENEELSEKAQTLDELVTSVLPYLPDVEPEVREVEVVKPRTPTDEEVEEWIKTHGGNHPAVRSAQRLEPGSTEEWQALYGKGGPKTKRARTTVAQDTGAEVATTLLPEEEQTLSEQTLSSDEAGPTRVVKLHDQDVDLDEVLKGNIDDIVKYAEGHGEEFEAALLDREQYNAESQGKEPRKGLIEGLGYDYSDFVDEEPEEEPEEEYDEDDVLVEEDDEEEEE